MSSEMPAPQTLKKAARMINEVQLFVRCGTETTCVQKTSNDTKMPVMPYAGAETTIDDENVEVFL